MLVGCLAGCVFGLRGWLRVCLLVGGLAFLFVCLDACVCVCLFKRWVVWLVVCGGLLVCSFACVVACLFVCLVANRLVGRWAGLHD